MMDLAVDWGYEVENLGPRLYRYFCARFDSIQADELTQETLVRLVEKFNAGEFDHRKGSMAMFAFGIARFVRLEQSKQRQNLSLDKAQTIAGPDSFADFEQSQEVAQMRLAISRLPEPQQEILLLMVDQEMKQNEIAQHLDIPVGTIKSHIHRAKQELKTQLTKKSGVSHGQRL